MSTSMKTGGRNVVVGSSIDFVRAASRPSAFSFVNGSSLRRLCALLLFGSLLWWPGTLAAQTVPTGFVDTPVFGYWPEIAGMQFDDTGRMFVWERGGRVWIIENDVKLPAPLIDLSEEVGAWDDHGMLGLALHPNFSQNGFIYLFYVVDHHYLTKYGTPSYNPNSNEYNRATIGRITRYTANAADNFHSVDPASRQVLLGEGVSTGCPILSTTHGVGSLVFGMDGTLLASCGDGAMNSDGGSDPTSYYVNALSEGILKAKENVGAFRAQMVDSLSGKILRLDPITGDGVPSNPYYDPTSPRAPRSRVWALGLRNPFRVTLKPGSGSHDPTAGNPGVVHIGNVGYNTWEELEVGTGPRVNFGWPIYEGLDHVGDFIDFNPDNQDAPNPLYGIGGCTQQYFKFRDLLTQATLATPSWPNPCNPAQQVPSSIPHFVHTRPLIDWQHGTGPSRTGTFAGTDAAVINIGATGSPISGPQFGGNCSIGGVFYEGANFPATYQNSYFFGDLGNGWIRNLTFDSNGNPVSVRDFATGVDGITFIGVHPLTGVMYYSLFWSGIHKVHYAGSGNKPPTAVASSNIKHGPSPLTVQFAGGSSSDPEGRPLTYLWDFGDGSLASALANPSHTFNAPAGVPTRFDVRLTVTDDASATSSATLVISVNNTPPSVAITDPPIGTKYPMTGDSTYSLTAFVADAEHADSQLLYEWQRFLYHNNHNHPNPIDANHATSTVLSPIGCDGNLYFYRIVLTVTDPAGLSGRNEVDLYPDCTNTPPTISDIADQIVNSNTPTEPIAFTVGDAQTAVASLTLSGSSSNPTLVPNSNIVFGGSGASRTVTIAPAANQTGTATITITVSDGALLATDTFVLLVVNAPADFALSGSPTSQTVVPGGSTNYGVTITPIGSFSGPVTLSVSGLPTGATGSFTPNPATASSTLTVTTSAGTPTGTYPLTLTAVSGALTHTATVSLSVATTAPAVVLFDAVGPGSAGASVANGSSLSWSHTVTAAGSNRLLTVSVAVGKEDTGLSLAVSYNGVSLTSAGIVHSNDENQGFVQLFYLNAPPTGAHPVQVTLTGGTADMEGGSISFTGVDPATPIRNITTSFGSGPSPRLSVASAPGNMVVDALVSGCAGGITSSTTARWIREVNCSTAGGNGAQSTAAGAASVTMGYTVPSDWWGMIGMDVVAATSTPSTDFTLSGSPASQTVVPGGSTTYGVTIAPTGGFAGAVTLSVSGLPAGATGSFTPNPATASSTLAVTTSASTPTGTYPLTLTGVSGTLTHTATITLVVNAPADFTLSGSPASQAVVPGSPTNYGVTVTPTGGFTGAVTLSVSGLPTGATGSFTPNPATASSTLAVTTSASTPTGTYPLTLTGVSGTLTHTATVTLVVSASTTITVTAPNTAVTWQSGTSQNVTFAHNLGVGHLVNIDVSRDGGTSWTPAGTLTTTAATSGTYVWLVSGPSTQQARIRVSSASVAASDMSDVNFTITARITVTAPNTAVTWGAGSTRTITWTHNLGVSQAVDIAFSPDNGLTWIPIASGVPNTTATIGNYTGPVPAVVTTQGRVRVSWSGNPTESDMSDGLVTLAAPAVTVTAPNTNVSWAIGSARNITWTHNLGTAESVNIEVSRDGGSTWSVLAASRPNTGNTSGTFSWNVNGPATTAARVRITWTRDGTVRDLGDVNFRVTSSITVTAPNTAVTWAAGSLRAITWTHSLGAAQMFDVDFSADNGVTWVPMASGVLSATATTGTFTGAMPTTLTTQALVRVSPMGVPINGDTSNVVFTVAAPTLTVTAPNTNVNWKIGSARNITWTHNLGTLESVNIEVSGDGGSTWSVLAASRPNTGNTSGTFSWTVTGPATTLARIRVTWVRDGAVLDVSNVNFRIQ